MSGKSLVLAIMSIAAFLGTKLWINGGSLIALNLQFFTQVFSLSFAASFFVAVSGFQNEVIRFLEKIRLKKFFIMIGMCTLDNYAVQGRLIDLFIGRPFPINFILTCSSIIIVGWCVHQLSTKIYNVIMRLPGKKPSKV